MQILNFLFGERLIPLWLAGQLCFNLANVDVIAIQNGNHSWDNIANHEISHCLLPTEPADLYAPDLNRPDPHTAPVTFTPITVQPVLAVAPVNCHYTADIYLPYLPYLLKQPPPALSV